MKKQENEGCRFLVLSGIKTIYTGLGESHMEWHMIWHVVLLTDEAVVMEKSTYFNKQVSTFLWKNARVFYAHTHISYVLSLCL